MTDIPASVIDYARRVFDHVEDSVSGKISKFPNIPEESLDISFIESLSEFSGPVIVDSNWAVEIATHFIGSIRHHRRYEIADIGVVVVFKEKSTIVARKLILLQSKRLYPNNFRLKELEEFDYELGLGMLMRDDRAEVPIFSTVQYRFDNTSKYGALKAGSRQCMAIQQHFQETNIPVYYMMYNPVTVPWCIDHPLGDNQVDVPARTFGTRVVESAYVHERTASLSPNSPLPLSLLQGAGEGSDLTFGAKLSDFFEEILACKKGYRFQNSKDQGIRALFSRKSGPIFCVIEITIETK